MLRPSIGPLKDQLLHAQYKPGHFIVSFSGCNVMLKDRQLCNAMFQEYARAAL